MRSIGSLPVASPGRASTRRSLHVQQLEAGEACERLGRHSQAGELGARTDPGSELQEVDVRSEVLAGCAGDVAVVAGNELRSDERADPERGVGSVPIPTAGMVSIPTMVTWWGASPPGRVIEIAVVIVDCGVSGTPSTRTETWKPTWVLDRTTSGNAAIRALAVSSKLPNDVIDNVDAFDDYRSRGQLDPVRRAPAGANRLRPSVGPISSAMTAIGRHRPPSPLCAVCAASPINSSPMRATPRDRLHVVSQAVRPRSSKVDRRPMVGVALLHSGTERLVPVVRPLALRLVFRATGFAGA